MFVMFTLPAFNQYPVREIVINMKRAISFQRHYVIHPDDIRIPHKDKRMIEDGTAITIGIATNEDTAEIIVSEKLDLVLAKLNLI